MTNVIQLKLPAHTLGLPARRAALVTCFAEHRRTGDDVFWLKENAELLNILESTKLDLADHALDAHQAFYDGIENRLSFFPQYYRFLLSICLDLEDLGLPGTKGETLAHWIADQGLADAELSDLQRAEAERLLARRGAITPDPALRDRLHAFVNRPNTFALPNKKAAYELTHIAFYLSEYGRKDPELSENAIESLEYAGILAYLDQNSDLLAEVCVALRYAGRTPPQRWEDWLETQIALFAVETDDCAPTADDYHDYFVGNWAMALAGRGSFTKMANSARMAFWRPERVAAPLREMSQCMYQLDDARSADWEAMRPVIEHALSEEGHTILSEVEASTQKFDAFFEGFARVGLQGIAV
jgi:hypothetical protein